MTLTSRTAGFYPSPRQYLHSDFLASVNNNNIWGFGTEETDALIQIYEEDLAFDARLEAMHRLDAIVHDEAFYIPFWSMPYHRLVYWDYVRFPEFYLPRRTQGLTDYMVFWIDPDRKAALEQAMRTGEAFAIDEAIDKDYYGVRERLQQVQ